MLGVLIFAVVSNMALCATRITCAISTFFDDVSLLPTEETSDSFSWSLSLLVISFPSIHFIFSMRIIGVRIFLSVIAPIACKSSGLSVSKKHAWRFQAPHPGFVFSVFNYKFFGIAEMDIKYIDATDIKHFSCC